MSSKKSSAKKASSKKVSPKKAASAKKVSALAAAAKAGDTEAVVLAVSPPATAALSKEAAILDCLKKCFFENGLPPVSPSSLIDWEKIQLPIVTSIGDCVTACIIGKGFQSPGWALAFRSAHKNKRISLVSELVAGMATVVKP